MAIISGIATIAYYVLLYNQYELYKYMFSLFVTPQENPALVREATIGSILGGACAVGGIALLVWKARAPARLADESKKGP
jgi:hypothetical protein